MAVLLTLHAINDVTTTVRNVSKLLAGAVANLLLAFFGRLALKMTAVVFRLLRVFHISDSDISHDVWC